VVLAEGTASPVGTADYHVDRKKRRDRGSARSVNVLPPSRRGKLVRSRLARACGQRRAIAHDRPGLGAARAPDSDNSNAGCRAGVAAAGRRGRRAGGSFRNCSPYSRTMAIAGFEPDADTAALVTKAYSAAIRQNDIFRRQDRPPQWRVVGHGREVCRLRRGAVKTDGEMVWLMIGTTASPAPVRGERDLLLPLPIKRVILASGWECGRCRPK
jgi:hypothetical protein